MQFQVPHLLLCAHPFQKPHKNAKYVLKTRNLPSIITQFDISEELQIQHRQNFWLKRRNFEGDFGCVRRSFLQLSVSYVDKINIFSWQTTSKPTKINKQSPRMQLLKLWKNCLIKGMDRIVGVARHIAHSGANGEILTYSSGCDPP